MGEKHDIYAFMTSADMQKYTRACRNVKICKISKIKCMFFRTS